MVTRRMLDQFDAFFVGNFYTLRFFVTALLPIEQLFSQLLHAVLTKNRGFDSSWIDFCVLIEP